MESQDSVSYASSLSNENAHQETKPYLKKELLYVIDNNGSTDYSRNQVQFETVSISNNGKFADYKNAFLSIPVVVTLSRNGAADAVTSGDGHKLLNFKNSNVNLIDSIIIDYGNENVIQQNANINAFCSFVQHTELSENDVLVNGEHIGYRLDSSEWDYDESKGIVCKGTRPSSFKHLDGDQEVVMTNASVQASGENCYQEINTKFHVFRYDCIIRLKDLLFFQKMPLVRGANIKITVNLNQSDTVTTYASGDVVTSVSTLKGSSNFVLVNDALTPTDGVETISLKVVKNGVYEHVKKQCRLYIPVYTMSPKAEDTLLSQKQKTFIYSDLFVKMVKDIDGNFRFLLTNSLSRIKRLVIVPMLSKHVSGAGVSISNPQESIYAHSPSGTSPAWIRDFNCKISGSNLYDNSIEFKYQHYLNEMNGFYGLNANLETGSVSSLISMKDYNNTMGYLVCDLSRRYSYDESTPVSIEIQGVVASAMKLDLLCFIEYSKNCTIDLSTGKKIA